VTVPVQNQATLFADISNFQVPVDDRYPYRFLSMRSNDGTYYDYNFKKNLAWAKAACDAGKLDGFIVYFVWESNWQQTVNTFKSAVGTPHPKMAAMIDIEGWSGRYTSDQSVGINASRESVISFLGGNRLRCIGYANKGDFDTLWPSRNDANVIIANYSYNPTFTNKVAHQFSSSFYVPPFGNCDINSADGVTSTQFAAQLGIVGKHSVEQVPTGSSSGSSPSSSTTPVPVINKLDVGEDVYTIIQNSQNGAKSLVGTGIWEPLNYGPTAVSEDDILVLLGYPLCKNPTAEPIKMSPQRFALMKAKVAGK
jgi:hypothetical protein